MTSNEKRTFVEPEIKRVKRDWFNIRVAEEKQPTQFKWYAYYEGEEEKNEFGVGSTPYMAILDLINSKNPTEWWSKQNG